MRVVYARGDAVRGLPLVRVVGKCRACGKKNVLWIVKGLIVTFSLMGCEYCKSGDAKENAKRRALGLKVKKTKSDRTGVQWTGLGCWGGKEVAKNFPEKARAGDIVV